MTEIQHYTTLSVEEYAHLSNTILALRKQTQLARQLLESNRIVEALELLKKEDI